MITAEQAAVVKGLLARGEKQHDVAAFFGVNGGRIAEIKTGARHPTVAAAAKRELPTPQQIASGFAIHSARQALQRAKLGIEAAMSFLDDVEGHRDLKEPRR